MKFKVYLLIICALLFCGCKESILHDLSESESNRIITRLQTNGIESEKEKQADGRWSIIVNQKDVSQAIRTIEMSRLIPKGSSEDKKPSSVGASREEQRFSLERGMSGELEKTLNQIPGVLESRVHLTLPSTDPVFGTRIEKSLSSASVLLIVEPEANINSSDVGQLVAGASGIPAKDVSVLQTIAAPQMKIEHPELPNELSPISSFLQWSRIIPMLLIFIGGVGLVSVGVLKKYHVGQSTT